jgi:hypothetical protein
MYGVDLRIPLHIQPASLKFTTFWGVMLTHHPGKQSSSYTRARSSPMTLITSFTAEGAKETGYLPRCLYCLFRVNARPRSLILDQKKY